MKTEIISAILGIVLISTPVFAADNWADTLMLGIKTNLFNAVIKSYTDVLGIFFYIVLEFLALGMIYIRTNNFGTVAITGMFTSVMVAAAARTINLSPSLIYTPMAIAVAFGIAIILYRAVR